MSNILLVEDVASFGKSVKRELEARLFHKVTVVPTLAEAKGLLKNSAGEFALAVVDYSLPDAPDGEGVRQIVSTGVPTIALSATLKGSMRENLLSLKAVDYVIKGRPDAVPTLVREVERALANSRAKALVVDAHDESGKRTRAMLEACKFSVIGASDGKGALDAIGRHADLKAVLVDADLPDMEGWQLVSKIRLIHGYSALPVIGVAGWGEAEANAAFVKYGANDFIARPFRQEELYSRLTMNMELAEQRFSLKRAHNFDFLTGLPNRTSFFGMAEKLFENYKRDNLSITIGLIDLDRFRELNARCGHGMGDAVLKEVARLVKSHFRKSDVVCRFGGEEFCVMLTNVGKNLEKSTFEKFRRLIAETEVEYRGKKARATVSIGVTGNYHTSLEGMVRRADEMLMEAKNAGRNTTVVDPARLPPPKKGK